MDEMLRRRLMMQPDGDIPPANVVWYTSSDGNTIDGGHGNVDNVIAAQANNIPVSNQYVGGRGRLVFSKAVTSLRLVDIDRLLDIWFPQGLKEITTATNPANTPFYTGIYGDLEHIESFSGGGLVRWNSEQDIYLPSLTSVTQYAFMGSKFRSIRVPSLQSIPDSYSYNRYFCNGNYVETLDIRSCASIGTYAIYQCQSLDTLILGSTIPSVATGNFDKAPLSNIYVPDDMVDAYKADAYWSTYASSIKPYSQM